MQRKRKPQATPLAEISRRADRISRWVEYTVCGLIMLAAAAMIAVAVVGLTTWPELPR
uniref:Uncharacterized protein n=1 Tax=viral metagenome TaxID=1070528 RepID=A0A6M3M1D3_9ZZZZ